ncbi:MAG: hypothetical protein VKK94_04800 [Cyanobacteriota bacterium]|nr:hypothetical protein [Cyanobacteriota bacterium]
MWPPRDGHGRAPPPGALPLGILFAVGIKIVSVSVCVLMLRTPISSLWFVAMARRLDGVGIINR